MRKPEGDGYPIEEYPQSQFEEINWPKEVVITYAVCGKICGNSEFIVDGQTQICPYCRKSMFRTDLRRYIIVPKERIMRNEEARTWEQVQIEEQDM